MLGGAAHQIRNPKTDVVLEVNLNAGVHVRLRFVVASFRIISDILLKLGTHLGAKRQNDRLARASTPYKPSSGVGHVSDELISQLQLICPSRANRSYVMARAGDRTRLSFRAMTTLFQHRQRP